MFYALSWFLVAAVLASWSLAAWALHAVAVWTVSSAGELSSAASGTSAMALPDWLAAWAPPEAARWASLAAENMGPLIDTVLQAAPALAGGLTVAAWVVWGIGSALLVLLGAGLHLLIAILNHRGGNAAGPKAGSLLSASRLR